MTAYHIGNIIFGIMWLLLYIIRPKTRKLQIWGSILLLPFGVLDIWFRPEYWNPPLLIKSIEPLSLETFLYCFTAGGIAAVFGAVILKNKFSQFNIKKIILFWLIASALFALFQGFKISSAMNNLNYSFLIIWIILFARNIKENYKSFCTAILFAGFTIIAINIGLVFFPNFVAEYWHLDKLWPTFLRTPTEEIFFAGILGALWTLLPKYLVMGKDNTQ